MIADKLRAAAQSAVQSGRVAFGNSAFPGPYIRMSNWGPAYFGPELTGPVGMGPDVVNALSFSPDGSFLAAATGGLPSQVLVYPVSSSGFGTIVTPGTVFTAGAASVKFSPNGDFIAVGLFAAPYIRVYNWSPSGFGALVAAPASPPSSGVVDIAWSPDQDQIVLVTGALDGFFAYNWSSSGFGSRLSNPSSAVSPQSLSFHPSGNYLAVGVGQAASCYVYNWSASGFGSRTAAPVGGTVVGGSKGVGFSPIGDSLIYSDGTNTRGYSWTTTFGSSLFTQTGPSEEVAFNPLGTAVALGASTSRVYRWSSAGLGVLQASVASANTSVAFYASTT